MFSSFPSTVARARRPSETKGYGLTVQVPPPFSHGRALGSHATFTHPLQRDAKSLGLPSLSSFFCPSPSHVDARCVWLPTPTFTTLTHTPRRSSLSPTPAGEQRLLAWQDAKADSLAHHHHAQSQPEDRRVLLLRPRAQGRERDAARPRYGGGWCESPWWLGPTGCSGRPRTCVPIRCARCIHARRSHDRAVLWHTRQRLEVDR